MKTYSLRLKKRFKSPGKSRQERGFALVISLSLMVLLTVLAVGLLGLSTISIRTSSYGNAMYTARANARLALALAIGQLQKNAGPDQRITAPSNLANDQNAPGIAGAWESWKPNSEGGADYENEKESRFLGYLMSDRDFTANPDADTLPSGGSTELLLGAGTLGNDGNTASREIRAPRVEIGQGTVNAGSLAWATLDEGVKGRIDLLPQEEKSNESVGMAIARVGSAARNNAGTFEGLEWLDETYDKLSVSLPKLVSTAEVNLMTQDKETFGKYFHDFSITSTSLQTDVANGGLKTDLSMVFDRATLPTDLANRRLYSGTTTPLGGSTAPDPQLALFHNYYRLYQRTTPNDNPNDGLKTYVSSRYRLNSVTDRVLRDSRYEPDLSRLNESVIMPTIAKVDIVFSLVVRDVHGGRATTLKPAGYPFMLHLMYLPVITLHNPYNTRLRFTQLEIEFEDLPMGFQFLVNNQPATSSMQAFNQLYTGKENGSSKKIFKMLLTGDLTANREVVFEPGETRIFGKPFPADWNWNNEEAGTGADGKWLFDWRNDQTQKGSRIMPGMITGPNDGIGYDVDWLAPTGRQPWLTARTGEGIIPVKPNELISVRYGPMKQASTPQNKFSVKLRLNPGTTNDYSTTQVFFKDEARLKQILEEGSSPRFPNPRTFPETYPKSGVEGNKTAQSLYESNGTAISRYVNAKPFAVFSLSGKTTMDAFTRSRPVADTGVTHQMATCDFTTTVSQGSSPFEFVLTPVRNGEGGIESDGVKGYFFGGHGANRGSTSATIYEIPQAPLQSIAQLRHANTASLGTAPYFTYSVGESRAHPALPADQARLTDNSRILFDHSWLANDQLWDRYWFSSLATLQGAAFTGSDSISQSGLATAFFNGERRLPNPRNIAYVKPGVAPADTAASVVADPLGALSSAHILTRGGFNVNSVSRDAWISVLSSLARTSVPIGSGQLEASGDDIPVLRVRRPTGGVREGRELKNMLWNSYRLLEEDQIRALADQMVAEVRARGPFLSMSEFVNRQLSSGEFSRKGALQAAIDRTNVNEIMEANAMDIDSSALQTYGWKNPDALLDSTTGSGAPGEISQGDILSAIGSFITVRSDTFRVRAYGDCRDKQGNVLARVWCEATVQRFPEYVDTSDAPELAASSEANEAFGRRFSVIAFRWIHPEEV